jgi:hypothetical protein
MPSREGSGSSTDAEDRLWETSFARPEKLKGIIESHFKISCDQKGEIGKGSFARCYRYELADRRQIVARVLLPIREYSKTEAEVATMCFLRGEHHERPFQRKPTTK